MSSDKSTRDVNLEAQGWQAATSIHSDRDHPMAIHDIQDALHEEYCSMTKSERLGLVNALVPKDAYAGWEKILDGNSDPLFLRKGNFSVFTHCSELSGQSSHIEMPSDFDGK